MDTCQLCLKFFSGHRHLLYHPSELYHYLIANFTKVISLYSSLSFNYRNLSDAYFYYDIISYRLFMMGLEVGVWFASAFINELVDRACSYLGDRYEYRSSVQHKLKILDDGLRKIQALLHEADQRNIENPALKEWLLDLKDAAYDAAGVFDIFEYKILEERAEGKRQV